MKSQKTSVTVTAIIVGLFVASLFYVGAKNKNQTAIVSDATAELAPLTSQMTDYDFGRISMAKGKVSKTFLLKNESGSPTLIKKMYTSCMCTSAILKTASQNFGPVGMPGHLPVPSINLVVSPGEEFQIETIFDPAAHGPAGIGPIERSVIIESDDFVPKELTIKAVVTP